MEDSEPENYSELHHEKVFTDDMWLAVLGLELAIQASRREMVLFRKIGFYTKLLREKLIVISNCWVARSEGVSGMTCL